MERCHDGFASVWMWKTQGMANLMHQSLEWKILFKNGFFSRGLSQTILLYLIHISASVGLQSPFLRVVHVKVPTPPAASKLFQVEESWRNQRPGKESMGQDAARSVKRVSIPVLPPVRTTSSNTIGWASFSGIRHKLPPPHCPNYFLFSLAKVDFDVSVPVSSLLPEVDVTDVLLPQLERIAHCSLHLAGSKQSTLRP